jgi:hypothetical protein
MESHSNGNLCLLLSRLIEGEASERDFAEIEMLFRTEPAALDAYFHILETHSMLHWGMGALATELEQQYRSCAFPGRAGLVTESVVAPALSPPTVTTGRASAIIISPQTESAPTAAHLSGADDARLSEFVQHHTKPPVPVRTVM